MPARSWEIWDDPDRDQVVTLWKERGIHVVFPLPWAKARTDAVVVARARERVAELEGKTGRTIVPGSVLLAFSRHEDQPAERLMNPDVSRGILT